MQRRDFVRMLAAFGFAPDVLLGQQQGNQALPPPAPVPWTLGLNPKTPLPHTQNADVVADGDSKFFSAEQMSALTRLSDLLVPPLGDKPGALQAEVPDFLDFLISISPASRRTLYTGGLDWVNAESKRKYGKAFAQLSGADADALVKPWLRTWMSDHPPTEAHADFINIAHADIRTATMNSKPWNDAEMHDNPKSSSALGLYWSPIDPDVYAEDFKSVHTRPSPGHTIAAPKSSHTTPSYPR